MNKKGFAFIETIIVVVVLSASLIYLYSSYSAIISDEETRIYYDDVAYLYRSNYVKNFLLENTSIKDSVANGFDDTYILPIGVRMENLFNADELNRKMNISFENIIQAFNINQILLVKREMYDDCVNDSEKCTNTMERLDDYNLKEYINSINDMSSDYYLIIEYKEKVDANGIVGNCKSSDNVKCTTYYTSLKMDINEKVVFLSDYIKSLYTTDGEKGLYLHDADLENGAGDNSYRYAGANPDNYVCFGYDDPTGAYASGWCPDDNLYRIIGVFNELNVDINVKEERIKLIKVKTYGTHYWSGSSSNTSNVWENSTLNTDTLNGTAENSYLTKMGTWSNKVATTRWQVGGAGWTQLATVTAKAAYENEVGSPVNNTIQDSKIGLMYVNEYGFAASPANWTTTLNGYNIDTNRNNNWMFLGVFEWTISRDSNHSSGVLHVDNTGFVGGYDVYTIKAFVRPTFSLLSSISYTGGTGTETDPFRIN